MIYLDNVSAEYNIYNFSKNTDYKKIQWIYVPHIFCLCKLSVHHKPKSSLAVVEYNIIKCLKILHMLTFKYKVNNKIIKNQLQFKEKHNSFYVWYYFNKTHTKNASNTCSMITGDNILTY